MHKFVLLVGLNDYPDVMASIKAKNDDALFLNHLDNVSAEHDKIEVLGVSIHQKITIEQLEKLSNLKKICVLGTSKKGLPLKYCQERGICVTSVENYCDEDTAEWILWQALGFFRSKKPAESFYGKTFGVAGAGKVGSLVIKKAVAMGANVLFSANSIKNIDGALQVSLPKLFSKSDVVSLCLPPWIKPLDAELLSDMKQSSAVINTCLGKVFHQEVWQDFLQKRPDVTLILDEIQGRAFKGNQDNVISVHQKAYETKESAQRLKDGFLLELLFHK